MKDTNMKTNTLTEQIRIVEEREALKPEVDSLSPTPELYHYLATHPRAYQEHKEAMEDIRRMTRFFA